MAHFASNLRRRAEALGISNAEAARRACLSERRYAHYVRGNREPDLATLVRIADALGTTPNWLLGVEDDAAAPTATSLLEDRLKAASRAMSPPVLEMIVVQAEAVAAMHRLPPAD